MMISLIIFVSFSCLFIQTFAYSSWGRFLFLFNINNIRSIIYTHKNADCVAEGDECKEYVFAGVGFIQGYCIQSDDSLVWCVSGAVALAK